MFIRNVITKNGFLETDMDVFIPHENDHIMGTFPDGFLWGTSSAAYQIEGAWNEGGNVWTFLSGNTNGHKWFYK